MSSPSSSAVDLPGNEELPEEISHGHGPQNSDEAPAELSICEKVFSIQLIFKEILRYLPKSVLLQTALVNKHWNYFSRDMLRNNEDELATLSLSCLTFDLAEEMLENAVNVPFSGLSLSEPVSCQYAVDSTHDMETRSKNFVEKIPLKYLIINLEKYGNCAMANYILRECLTTQATFLEGLTIVRAPEDIMERFPKFDINLNTSILPNLKFLRFPSLYAGSTHRSLYNEKEVSEKLMKSLFNSSPQVKIIFGTISNNCLKYLLPLKSPTLLEDFTFRPMFDDVDLIRKFVLEGPQLKRLQFSTRHDVINDESPKFEQVPAETIYNVAQLLNLLIKSSQNTLKSFSADNLDLLLITHKWDVPILQDVTELNLTQTISFGFPEQEEGFPTLTKLNWEKYFPNLKQVWVSDFKFEVDEYNRDFYVDPMVRQSSSHCTCPTVTKIVIECNAGLSEEAYGLSPLRILFPNAKELEVNYENYFYLTQHHFIPIFPRILKQWSDLEVLTIKFSQAYQGTDINLDKYFIGVNKAELAYWAMANMEHMDSLEIVPEYPGLLNFPKLRKLIIQLSHANVECNEETAHKHVFHMSRFTPLCVFARLPNMQVEIQRGLCRMKQSCRLALPHLQPYVPLTSLPNSY